MRNELDRLWDSFFDGRPRVRIGEWFPSIDVSETKNDIVVKVELPGMDQKDINISLSDGHLIIIGCSKTPRCKAPEILRSEAYLEVRRRWAFFSSLLDFYRGGRGRVSDRQGWLFCQPKQYSCYNRNRYKDIKKCLIGTGKIK